MATRARQRVQQWRVKSDDWDDLLSELVEIQRIAREDGSEIVVGRDKSGDIFIGWLGVLEDCNFFYVDEEEAAVMIKALNVLL